MNPPPATPEFVPDVAYRGDYPDFGSALRDSTGYAAGQILERTRQALHKVRRGEAAFERDSVTFDQLELPLSLLGYLLLSAGQRGGRLSVLDFGGSLGSTYFQCRSVLRHLAAVEWSIVEQPAHVACGRAEFANGELQFYDTIEACLRERQPDVLLLSGVLQCLPSPWDLLREAASAGPFTRILIDRLPLIDAPKDRLTVEIVSPRIYAASYPAWFFSRPALHGHLPAGWQVEGEFDAVDRQLLDGVELRFKGFSLRRPS